MGYHIGAIVTCSGNTEILFLTPSLGALDDTSSNSINIY